MAVPRILFEKKKEKKGDRPSSVGTGQIPRPVFLGPGRSSFSVIRELQTCSSVFNKCT